MALSTKCGRAGVDSNPVPVLAYLLRTEPEPRSLHRVAGHPAMDARKKEIEHLDSEIRRLEQQITQECVEMGRRVAAADVRNVRHEELLKYLNSVGTLRRSMEGFRTDIERIRDTVRQIDARAQEIEQDGRRRDQLLRERRERFMELGAGSYALYRRLPDRDAWKPFFEEVLKLDAEAERRQEDLRALEAEEQGKGFFEKLRLKARKVGLRGEVSRLDREKSAAYEAAGERIAGTDFARHAEGALRQLFEALEERRKAAESFSLENDRRVEEIEAARRELQRLEIDGRPEEKVREIEGRIAGLQKELDVMHCWIGQIFLERDLRREVDEPNLAAKFEIVSGLRESIRKKRQQIDRLRAEIEIEEISRGEKDKRARRKMLEEELRVKERQIGVLDLEINLGLRRLEELRRVMAGEAPYSEAPPLPPTPDLYPPAPPGPPPSRP